MTDDMRDAPPPPSVDEMKDAIRSHWKRLQSELALRRRERDDKNERIRELVAEVAEAERLVRALEPRKRGRS